jgi:UDP-glucose 4-epimerase
MFPAQASEATMNTADTEGTFTIHGRNVLITGGLGFIGSNLARRCLELGAKVTLYDCLDPRSGGNMHNVADIQDRVNIVLNDIRNFEGVCACIRGQDVLFSCAAYTSHPYSMKEPLTDIDVNCKGIINLLEAARRFNPGAKIVHVGTSTQAGKMVVNPIDELHPEFPVDIYSANKSASEKYVLIYGHAYGMRTTVVRFANVFGPRSNIRNPDFGVMNYFVGLALQGRDLTIFGEGRQMRNIMYIEDAVEALIAAAQSPASEGEVLLAVADRHYSVLDMAEAITRHIGGRVRKVEWPRERQVIEVGDAILTNAKIKRVLGWSPKCALDDGLIKTREYFLPRLQQYL